MASSSAIAERLIGAYRTGVPIAPIRREIKGIAAAYAVQQETVTQWQRAGRTIAGRKIGLTAKAVQEQLGVGEPDFGTLFADMIKPDGATLPWNSVLQPRVEAEIAFILKANIGGAAISPETVLAATDFVAPALEICGSRIAHWDIAIEDTIADNASSGLVVLGTARHKPASLEALAAAAMTIRHNGAAAGEGSGAACLGNPAIAVAWLAEALGQFGSGLRAGDVVMSGALAKMLPAEPGDSFIADFGAWGTVSTRFAP